MRSKVGVRASGGSPFEFGTITVSDAISMGTEGMRGSLISREIIADSIETVCFAERYDGLVAAAGCDKSLPGAMMAMARLDIPSVFVYGGSILPGHWKGEDIQIQTVFEAVGQVAVWSDGRRRALRHRDQRMPRTRLLRRHVHRQHHVIHRRGARTLDPRRGVGTQRRSAKTSLIPRSRRRSHEPTPAKGIYPRDILTREAFENAVTLVVAMGGSTNTALHLPAIAHEAGVDLTLDDIHAISMRTPLIADMKPGGKYVMYDLDRVGGIPLVTKRLLDAGLIHGDCMTVTGQTMAENLANVDTNPSENDVVRLVDDPLSENGGLVILHGNLAPTVAYSRSPDTSSAHASPAPPKYSTKKSR